MRWHEKLSSPVPTRLFGRAKDLEQITTCLTEGRDVAVVGPPGMGKTTVALEVLRRLVRSGWLTAWVPGAMTANATDLADYLAGQLSHVSRRIDSDDLEDILTELAEAPGDSEQHLGLAIEALALSAARLDCRAVLVVDDLDTFFAGGRSADLGLLLARKLRSVRQRSTALSVLYLMRSEATLREVFLDSSAPLFAGAATHALDPLSPVACEELIESRLREAGAHLTEAALSNFASRCRGVPLYLALAAESAATVAAEGATTVDTRYAETALADALVDCAPALAERIDSIRRSHRLGLEVARRLAVGESPYRGEKAPNNVTRALKNLERLGLAHQPAARQWALTDPFLEETLRGFDPHQVAARASIELSALPTSLPSPERTVSRLRGSDIWGLRSDWFEPHTVIRDSIYGDIKLTRLEQAILGTPEFQRLRRMRQLGTVQLVYPSATHTRMEHSLGVLAASSSVLEAMIRAQGDHLLRSRSDSLLDWREALALGRISGLVHELAALPFGVALEAELESHLIDYPRRLKRTWVAVVTELTSAGLTDKEADSLIDGSFGLNLWQAFDHETSSGDGSLVFIRDLLRGPLSADCFDRFARDRHALGLPPTATGRLATAMQLVEAMGEGGPENRLAVQEVDRPDVSRELIGHFTLWARHREVVARHRTTRSANAMLAAAVDHWIDVLEGRDGQSAASIVEERLLNCSDDGFIDYLVGLSAPPAPAVGDGDLDFPAAALNHLVGGLARRRLYRLAATASGGESVARQLFSEFGRSSRRRALEREAAQIAGIDGPGRILLVVPRPPPQTFGEALAGDKYGGLSRLREHRGELGSVVKELDDRLLHQWSVDVFADPDLPAKQRSQALDWLAYQLRLRWEWTRE